MLRPFKFYPSPGPGCFNYIFLTKNNANANTTSECTENAFAIIFLFHTFLLYMP